MNYSSLTKLAANLLISELKADLGKINFNQDKTTKLLIKKKKIVNVRIFTKEKIVLCGGNDLPIHSKKKITVHHSHLNHTHHTDEIISLILLRILKKCISTVTSGEL